MADRTPTVIEIAADSNKFSTNEKLVDALPAMVEVEASVTPQITIMTKLAVEKATDTTKRWFNDEQHPTKVNFNGASEGSAPSEGAGTITITNFSYVKKDDVISTGDPQALENILVTDTPTTTTVSVYRGFGNGNTVALTAGQALVMLAPSKVEAANYKNNRAVVNTEDFNIIQEFDSTFEVSHLANAVSTHFGGAGSVKQKEFVKMMIRLKKQMEWQITFGVRGTDQLSGEDFLRRSFRGTAEWLKDGTNYYEVPAGLFTESYFDQRIEDFANNNSDVSEVMMVASPRIVNLINQFGKDRMDTNNPLTGKYGVNIQTYMNGALDINIVKAPLWAQMPGAQGLAQFLDTSIMGLHYLIHPEITPDAEPSKIPNSTTGKFYTAYTLAMPSEFRHAMFVDVTG